MSSLSLLIDYLQDGETVFTVEYDVAQHENLDRSSGCGGPILVEIRRDVGDIVGFGLNVDQSSGHVFVESIKQVGTKKMQGFEIFPSFVCHVTKCKDVSY